MAQDFGVKIKAGKPKKDDATIRVTVHENAVPDEKPHELTPRERSRSKFYSVLEGSLNSISVGFTANFITAFAIALSASNTTIAFLTTLPSLVGAFLQLTVQHVRRLFATRKRHIVTLAVLQAFMWVPLLFLHEGIPHRELLLILFVTFNTMFGMLIGPVWNSFMGDIVEEDERGRFFGKRNMFTGLTAFIATIVAGVILNATKPSGPLIGFFILFGLAFVFRVMSAYFFSKISDPQESGINDAEPDVPGFLKTVTSTSFGKFTLFLMLFNFSVYLCAPFFAVYQLSILHWDYFTFTIIACASAISSFITMIVWGKYVDRLGSKNVLLFSGLLIPFVPLFWTFTVNPYILFFVEAYSGFVWAGFTLSTSTYLFDATDRRNRTRQLAVYTLLVQLAVFCGAIAGSAILGIIGKSASAYTSIFYISFILRLAIVLLFYNALKELRVVEIPIKGRIFKKFITVRPHHGIEYEPTLENVRAARAAGHIAFEEAKRIDEEVEGYISKLKGGRETPIRRMERQEDDEDTREYLRKLKKR